MLLTFPWTFITFEGDFTGTFEGHQLYYSCFSGSEVKLFVGFQRFQNCHSRNQSKRIHLFTYFTFESKRNIFFFFYIYRERKEPFDYATLVLQFYCTTTRVVKQFFSFFSLFSSSVELFVLYYWCVSQKLNKIRETSTKNFSIETEKKYPIIRWTCVHLDTRFILNWWKTEEKKTYTTKSMNEQCNYKTKLFTNTKKKTCLVVLGDQCDFSIQTVGQKLFLVFFWFIWWVSPK